MLSVKLLWSNKEVLFYYTGHERINQKCSSNPIVELCKQKEKAFGTRYRIAGPSSPEMT